MLKEAFENMVMLGLPTGSIVAPNYDPHVDDKFHIRVKNVSICQTCSDLVTTVKESLKFSTQLSLSVNAKTPKQLSTKKTSQKSLSDSFLPPDDNIKFKLCRISIFIDP